MHSRLALTLSAFALAAVAACNTAPASSAGAGTSAPGTPAPGTSAPARAPASTSASGTGSAETIAGTIAETMNSGGYTYMRLQTGQKDVWVAASEQPVKTGERVTVAVSMPMENFRSKTLNRDFPLIYFVSSVARDGEAPAAMIAPPAPALAGSHDSAPSAAPQAIEPIAPPKDGMKIADLWAQRKALAGKVVVVRGKVVKVNNAIMGKNWFHLQDGSGGAKDGTNDLTITSSATVTLGDIVTVSGTLAIDKDFGAGYAYDAIVEDAKVTDVGKSAMR